MVPSGSGWKIAAVFALGRCRGRRTSRQDREKAQMWTTHLSLVAAAFCSRPRLQFVRGCPKRPWCDTYTRYNGSSFSSFPPYFLIFWSAGSFKKKTGTRANNIVWCCLRYFYNYIFRYSSRFFLCRGVRMHQGRMVIVLYQRSSLLPKIKWLYSCIHKSF